MSWGSAHLGMCKEKKLTLGKQGGISGVENNDREHTEVQSQRTPHI